MNGLAKQQISHPMPFYEFAHSFTSIVSHMLSFFKEYNTHRWNYAFMIHDLQQLMYYKPHLSQP